MIYLNPGDKVWYPYIGHDIVVQALVVEVDDIYSRGDNKSAVWHYRYIDGSDACRVATDEKDENGWALCRDVSKEELSQYHRVNQLIWIDEHVGYDISLGDECFLTLHAAMSRVRPTKKKHLKRRLKKARCGSQRFISKTWAMAGDKHPGFEKMPNKKIYVMGYK